MENEKHQWMDGWMDGLKYSVHSLVIIYSGNMFGPHWRHSHSYVMKSFYLSRDCFRQARVQQNQDKNTSEDADLYGHPFGFNV